MADFIQEDESPQTVTLWDKPDKLPEWQTCEFVKFLRHLERAEQGKGIVWRRSDAYSVARGSEARWN